MWATTRSLTVAARKVRGARDTAWASAISTPARNETWAAAVPPAGRSGAWRVHAAGVFQFHHRGIRARRSTADSRRPAPAPGQCSNHRGYPASYILVAQRRVGTVPSTDH